MLSSCCPLVGDRGLNRCGFPGGCNLLEDGVIKKPNKYARKYERERFGWRASISLITLRSGPRSNRLLPRLAARHRRCATGFARANVTQAMVRD